MARRFRVAEKILFLADGPFALSCASRIMVLVHGTVCLALF